MHPSTIAGIVLVIVGVIVIIVSGWASFNPTSKPSLSADSKLWITAFGMLLLGLGVGLIAADQTAPTDNGGTGGGGGGGGGLTRSAPVAIPITATTMYGDVTGQLLALRVTFTASNSAEEYRIQALNTSGSPLGTAVTYSGDGQAVTFLYRAATTHDSDQPVAVRATAHTEGFPQLVISVTVVSSAAPIVGAQCSSEYGIGGPCALGGANIVCNSSTLQCAPLGVAGFPCGTLGDCSDTLRCGGTGLCEAIPSNSAGLITVPSLFFPESITMDATPATFPATPFTATETALNLDAMPIVEVLGDSLELSNGVPDAGTASTSITLSRVSPYPTTPLEAIAVPSATNAIDTLERRDAQGAGDFSSNAGTGLRQVGAASWIPGNGDPVVSLDAVVQAVSATLPLVHSAFYMHPMTATTSFPALMLSDYAGGQLLFTIADDVFGTSWNMATNSIPVGADTEIQEFAIASAGATTTIAMAWVNTTQNNIIMQFASFQPNWLSSYTQATAAGLTYFSNLQCVAVDDDNFIATWAKVGNANDLFSATFNLSGNTGSPGTTLTLTGVAQTVQMFKSAENNNTYFTTPASTTGIIAYQCNGSNSSWDLTTSTTVEFAPGPDGSGGMRAVAIKNTDAGRTMLVANAIGAAGEVVATQYSVTQGNTFDDWLPAVPLSLEYGTNGSYVAATKSSIFSGCLVSVSEYSASTASRAVQMHLVGSSDDLPVRWSLV